MSHELHTRENPHHFEPRPPYTILDKMSLDFLSEGNVCGQTVLKLVSRGNAIIAELLRLSDYVPSVFKLETRDEQEKYKFILSDFNYFECPEFYENKIDANPVCQICNECSLNHQCVFVCA